MPASELAAASAEYSGLDRSVADRHGLPTLPVGCGRGLPCRIRVVVFRLESGRALASIADRGEIGGNDLIANVSSSQFGASLEGLLKRVAEPQRTVVMFELPLLPHKIAYGQVQRGLARKYGVWLIPKRYFVSVIEGADATSDGIHLAVAGTHRMANLVAQSLSQDLKR